jgi:ABC-type spermidine/putrescine transport system permease subunit I
VHIYLPFVVLPIYAVPEKLDGRLIEATADLGASPWRLFLTIVLPPQHAWRRTPAARRRASARQVS